MKRLLRWWREWRKPPTSSMQIWISREKTIRLDACDATALRTGARANHRRAKQLRRKQNFRAVREIEAAWNERAAAFLERTADEMKDGKLLREMPRRKQRRIYREAVELMDEFERVAK